MTVGLPTDFTLGQSQALGRCCIWVFSPAVQTSSESVSKHVLGSHDPTFESNIRTLLDAGTKQRQAQLEVKDFNYL